MNRVIETWLVLFILLAAAGVIFEFLLIFIDEKIKEWFGWK